MCPKRQYRKKRIRCDHHHQSMKDRAPFHPGNKGICISHSRLCKFCIRTFCLSKCLDHFDSVNIFHCRIIQIFCCLNRSLEAWFIIQHHSKIGKKSHYNRHQWPECQSPVCQEEINQNHNRCQQIGREFRDNMRQCCLDTVDSFHHNIFKCTGRCVFHIAKRYPRQLVTAGFSYICKYCKRCFMWQCCRKWMKQFCNDKR